jgi:hypothetical protein
MEREVTASGNGSFLSLLPVEVIAEVLERVGDRGFWGSKGLAPARLVSRKWQQALGELLEKGAAVTRLFLLGKYHMAVAPIPRAIGLSEPAVHVQYLPGGL